MAIRAFLITAFLGAGVAAFGQRDSSPSEMSDDVRRFHRRVVSLVNGAGEPSEFRIEFMGGSMVSHTSYNIHAGELVTKEFTRGAPMVERRGEVTDARVRELLRNLVAKRYWAFLGTRFVPDAPTFLFRFYGPDESYVDFSCDLDEMRTSPEKAEIRDLFLDFVADTNMSTVSEPQ